MKKILLSVGIILFAAGSIALGGTGAFFSDTETSVGNTFAAGAIDLKVDNTSYYNGNTCKEVTAGIFQWTGTSPFPVPGTPCTTTWMLDDLNNGDITLHKFFDFADLKPSDYSEDTISLHVNTNDAYLCANVKLTSNDDNGLTEPESSVDTTDGAGNGELAQNVNFIWWADDGDNVLEQGENVLPGGPLGALVVGQTATVALADSSSNIWNPANAPGPVQGNVTKYIGKAWCFGTITPAPLPSGAYPLGPAGDNNADTTTGTPADGGFSCNGSSLGNETQTDSLTADVSFSATQSRNNPGFVCIRETKLTLIKTVDNTAGGSAVATQWTLTGDSATTDIQGTTGSAAVTNAIVDPGTYNLSESPSIPGYIASAWSCVKNNGAPVLGSSITLVDGDNATCTITNTFVQDTAKLTITKLLIKDNGGDNVVGDFILSARNDTTLISYSASSSVQITVPVSATGTIYTAKETGVAGYQATFSGDCNAATHKLTLLPNDVKSCTITNDDLPANITLIKVVQSGSASPEDFELTVDGTIVPQNASFAVNSNTPHVINENIEPGYHFVSITGTGCPATLGGTATLNEGQAITCTITNAAN